MSGRRLATLSLLGAAMLAASGGCSGNRIDERRSLISSQASNQQLDLQVRKFWKLGMTREQVRLAADDARVQMRSTRDARVLQEINPGYTQGDTLVAKVTPPGIFIDVQYFAVHQQVGWLYFFFDDKNLLDRVVYRLSKDQEAEEHRATRVILPVPEGAAP